MFVAIDFPKHSAHLKAFSDYLAGVHFPARIAEHDGRMVLYVYDERHIDMAKELYQQFLQHDSRFDAVIVSNKVKKSVLVWRQFPVSILSILMSALGFFAIMFLQIPLINGFSFQGVEITNNTIVVRGIDDVMQSLRQGEWWRLLTPVFLHFDIMHVTFNATILWFLGSQVEKKEGSVFFMFYVVLAGVSSNVVQFYQSPMNLFGGMSGVNYGLLAYCGLLNYLRKQSFYLIPQGFFMVSVVMMVLGFSGVFSLIGYAIANWAHLAGFITGLLLALFSFRSKRFEI